MSAMTIDERKRIARLLIATIGEERTFMVTKAIQKLGDGPEAQVVLEVAIMAASNIRPDLAELELRQMAADRPDDAAEIQEVLATAPKPPGPRRGSWRSRTGRTR